jgi:hypothetical protein
VVKLEDNANLQDVKNISTKIQMSKEKLNTGLQEETHVGFDNIVNQKFRLLQQEKEIKREKAEILRKKLPDLCRALEIFHQFLEAKKPFSESLVFSENLILLKTNNDIDFIHIEYDSKKQKWNICYLIKDKKIKTMQKINELTLKELLTELANLLIEIDYVPPTNKV